MADKPTYADLERRLIELEKSQAALRDSERTFRVLSEESPNMIFINAGGRVVYANRRCEEITGYSQETFLSEDFNFLKLIAPEYIDLVKENFGKHMRGEDLPPYEYAIITRNGSRIETIINTRLIHYNGATAILGIVTDITERKAAERAIRESEEKHRSVLEANPDPVVYYDPKGRVIYFNPAFTKVFGWTLAECAGQKMDRFVPEDNRPETETMIRKVMSGEGFTGIETRRFTQNGDCIPVSISGAVYQDHEGNCVGSVITLRDIRDQKALEAQFLRAQRMESIGTLAGGIAHDFNNLLMGIQGRASLMLMGSDPSHPHFDHLKGIEEYVKYATDLTRQLLGFARGGKYEVRPTRLNDIIRQSSEMFGRTKKEINVYSKFEPDLWIVEVDRGQIEQVLLNLFVNAWQAMPGGGNLYLQTENVQLLDVDTKPYGLEPGRYVKVSVTDTGSGMDAKVMERIFDPFFTTKEMGRGTGLGLASAYGIVKNHRGIITVASQKGAGTTFNIHLPVSEKHLSDMPTKPEGIAAGSGVILMVDDEEMVVEVGKLMLETLGFTVLTAKSGPEALSLFDNGRKDIGLIILDMIMPGMSGEEVFERLKAKDPGVKVLLSSGYSMEGRASKILDQGCNGFIQKPFNLRQLSQKIKEILDA